MGQRTNPIGLRVGINRGWDALWFADRKQYAKFLKEDILIRKFLERISDAGVARIIIERREKIPAVTVYAARPGMVIGKKGSGIEVLLAQLKARHGIECSFNVIELRKPDLYAQVVADDIARQLKKRVSFKRAMEKSVINVMKAGAEGVRVECSGRLGGAEIARTEWIQEGRLPLHCLRAMIGYGHAEAHTPSGVCGVKVWINQGEAFGSGGNALEKNLGQMAVGRTG